MSADFVRWLNAALAMSCLFALSLGLMQGWRSFIAWRWVTAAFIAFMFVFAIVCVDAARDTTLTDYAHAPPRLWAISVAELGVLGSAIYATVVTMRGTGRRRR
jgi:hypothetical protein